MFLQCCTRIRDTRIRARGRWHTLEKHDSNRDAAAYDRWLDRKGSRQQNTECSACSSLTRHKHAGRQSAVLHRHSCPSTQPKYNQRDNWSEMSQVQLSSSKNLTGHTGPVHCPISQSGWAQPASLQFLQTGPFQLSWSCTLPLMYLHVPSPTSIVSIEARLNSSHHNSPATSTSQRSVLQQSLNINL